MSKISIYEVVPVPKLADKLVGTSVGGEPEDLTYNFTLGELLNLFIPNIPGNTLQGVLDFGNTATQNINLTGIITTTTLNVGSTANILNSNLTGQTKITGGLYDRLNSIGTAGQVLRSTGTQVEWYSIPNVIPTLQQVLASGNTADINVILTSNIQALTATANNVVSNTSLSVNGTLKDKDASVGTAGQLLSSTGTKVQWVDLPVYTATSPLSINSITRNISIQQASSTQNGYLSSADWITFDGKQGAVSLTTVGSSGPATLVGSVINVPNYTLSGLGGVPQTRTLTINGVTYNLSADRSWTLATGVSSVSATTPLFSTGGPNPDISIQQSSSSLNGYLSSTDWLTFNDKQPAGNYITSLTGEATGAGPGATAVTLSNAAVIGKLLTGLNITGSAISSSDSILTAFGKVQNQINGLIGGVQYQGVWNAATNTPALVSSVGTQGYYYIVSVAGNTNLNGITDWQVGDWAIFNGSTWNKVDNTDLVTSVNGQVGAVSLTTDNIPEGATNLYYLDSRARAALSFAAGSGAYNSTTGVITIPTDNSQILNGAGYITLVSLSATSPLSYNNLTGAFSIQVANTTQNGYLSSTDWNTFNGKQNYLNGTGLVKSVAGTISYITDDSANWNTAYNDSIVSAAVTGTATKTLTLNQQDGGTITASWSDIDTGLTSVGVSMPAAFSVANSPLTSNGTIAVTGAGTTLQYIDGTGALRTFPGLTGYVPYTGATTNVDLGEFGISAGYFQADLTPTGALQVGRMQWNATDGTMDLRLLGNNVTLQIGQENVTRVVNKSGIDLLEANYQVVRIRKVAEGGAQGQRLAVVLAQGNNENNSTEVIGLVTETINVNQEGFVTSFGEVKSINTTGSLQGETWVDGDILYLSSTVAGALTNVRPVAPNHSVIVGYVVYAHANNGKIYMAIDTGYELGELHNVYAPSPTANQSIYWNTTNSRYQLNTIGGILGYTPANAATTISTTAPLQGGGDLSANRTFSITQSGTASDGYLSSTDWNTFNNKQPAGSYVPTSRQLTINGTAYDLSADRTWSVGTVTSVAALTLGTSGTDLSSTVANGTTTPVITLNVPTASAANRGALSAADWSTFNTKVGGVTATSPLASSGGSTPNITIQQSSGSQDGYLSSTDWTTFNNKQAAGNYITSLTGEATGTGPGATAVTLNNASVTAKILTGINITGGTVQATDTMLTAFGKLQNQVNGLIGGSIYQGTWNASTNTPTLTSSVGTQGYYYIVAVAGTTNLDGITDWFVGDWAIFNGGVWQQVDNTDAVVSVNGQTGAVSLTTDNISEGVTNLYFTNTRARAALSFAAGSGAYNSTTGVITIPTNTSQLTNGANFITLASLSGTAPISYNSGTGAISITQSGTASNGYLSSTDWNTFNNKQATLSLTTTGTSGAATLVGATLNIPQYQSVITNPVTGTGTAGYVPKWTSGSVIGNSAIYDNSGNILIGTANLTSAHKLTVYSATAAAQIRAAGAAPSILFTDTDTNTNSYSGYVGIATAVNNFMAGTAAGDMVVQNYSGYPILFGIGNVIKMRLEASGQLVLTSTISNGTYTYTLPGATGTLALTSNIPVVTGYVPYTGATANVDLGGFNITASGTSSFNAVTLTSNLWLKNTGTYDFIISNNTSLTTNVVRAYYTTTDELRFYAKNTAGASVVPKIMVGDGTTFTQLLPLTGGTLTGALNGTTANFSSYYRPTAGTGFLNGGYGGVETTATTGPIYCIGDSYIPTGTTTGTMYGIGYSYNNFTGAYGPANTWGMYVAGGGSVGIFLSAGGAGYFSSTITASGNITGAYILGTYFNASAGNSENPTIGQVWTQSTGDNYLRKSTPAHFRSQVTDAYYLTNNIDSEQTVGGKLYYFNSGVGRMNADPRWNESGYDGDLGCLHIWSWTAAGVAYGRAGIALYSDTAYQYLTTKSGTTGLFANNNLIFTVAGAVNMTGSYGLNDNKLYLRTNGDNNHYIWNAADDWEEIVAYNGTGLRISTSTGTTLATFSASGNSMNITGNAATATGQQSGVNFTINTGGAGYGLVGVYNPNVHQGLFAMGAAYTLTAGGGIGNLYGLSWTYDSAGYAINTGYNLAHCMAVANAGTVYTVIGQGIWTSGIIRANGAISSGSTITASSFSGAGTGLTGTASGLSIGGSAGSAPNGSNINNYYDTTAGNGYGFRFWNGADNYKISMGASALYYYGPVTDYSIKTQMNDADTGRGFTWGRISYAPIAAINSTSGNMQIAGTFTSSTQYVANGNSSATMYGPNATWGASLWVGAATPNNAGQTAQVISTDGNLHLDSGTASKQIYMNYYSGMVTGIYGGLNMQNTYITNASYVNTNTYVRAGTNVYTDQNFGYGLIGLYSSYRFQGVFAMGDAYKLPVDGTTTGNLYGLAWSHPNAGGQAANLSNHGLLVVSNGVTQCALTNNIWCSGTIISAGGTMSGTLNFAQPVGLGFANGQYVKDNGSGGFVIYGAALIQLNSNTQTSNYMLVGGNYSANAYNSISSTRLMFGGGNSDAQENYYIGTNIENYGGAYTKLEFRWHTGIRMGAQPGYGGIRMYNTEDLNTQIFSVGETDNNVRVAYNLIVGGSITGQGVNSGNGDVQWGGSERQVGRYRYLWYGYWSMWFDLNGGTGGGNLIYADTLYATYGSVSDIRYKKEVTPSTYGLSEVLKMNTIKYKYDLPIEKRSGNDPNFHIGFSAQDMLDIIPEAVMYDKNRGVYAIANGELIPVLVNSIKELKAEINELKLILNK